ncbi:CsbD-like protein [Hartmannibacter diazotrophicus]|uniref:CsbD-like protein n=1 Tax=Hartmannibacter diazotrophicus TaxID=1482074 RepID=A0A2C9D5J2_9HYPH|nr:CsbD family protein [Hartmannibacter diazotrophicus]SON54785.1 CsbD-like protein [Hartmannibacter diazotrophicus]
MNWDQIEGKWREMTGSAKAQWGKLTDDDITEINGNREKLAGKLQAEYGKTKEEVEEEIDRWMSRH